MILRRVTNMEEKLIEIMNEMTEYLSVAQLKKLQEVLLKNLSEGSVQKQNISNDEYLKIFLDAKKIEGCSERTLDYYEKTIRHLLSCVSTPLRKMSTDEIRAWKISSIFRFYSLMQKFFG